MAARDLRHEVPEPPRVVGQWNDHLPASIERRGVQGIDVGHGDVGRGRFVHVGMRGPYHGERDRVPAQEGEAHLLLVHLQFEREHVDQVRHSRPQLGDFEVGSNGLELAHGRRL